MRSDVMFSHQSSVKITIGSHLKFDLDFSVSVVNVTQDLTSKQSIQFSDKLLLIKNTLRKCKYIRSQLPMVSVFNAKIELFIFLHRPSLHKEPNTLLWHALYVVYIYFGDIDWANCFCTNCLLNNPHWQTYIAGLWNVYLFGLIAMNLGF